MTETKRDITVAAKVVANQFRKLDELFEEYNRQYPNIPLKRNRFVLEGPASLRTYNFRSDIREQYNKTYRFITQQLYRGGELRIKTLSEVCKDYEDVYLHSSSRDGVFRTAVFITRKAEFHFKLRV